MRIRLAIGFGALALTACTGHVTGVAAEATSGSGGAAPTTKATTGSTSGSGGAPTSSTGSGVGGAGGSATCIPIPQDADAGFTQPTCADLSRLRVAHPQLLSDGGAATLSAGGSATLSVDLEDVSGLGFDDYPAVRFSTDVGTVSGEDAQFYAVLPCQSEAATVVLSLGKDIAKGTVVHVVAQAAMLGQTCPSAPALTVPIPVE